ncbi:predicted protein [Sclerotinia sclerotiorum 1980 UF-70]|uniref:Uncharacterized protein n=1 Tax=Sclerotinia sclerotiorum (strain ATCC 18683 / 1980 / Ss-1) TaxID=665079 RepID=A7E512_SCLS1|nr:predicted protein [Sclerotinia sclerotiorum 1980 UF-70]EDN90984.1 predicted protein [Sclerotinia sclerotiorum 1980 UF-70]
MSSSSQLVVSPLTSNCHRPTEYASLTTKYGFLETAKRVDQLGARRCFRRLTRCDSLLELALPLRPKTAAKDDRGTISRVRIRTLALQLLAELDDIHMTNAIGPAFLAVSLGLDEHERLSGASIVQEHLSHTSDYRSLPSCRSNRPKALSYPYLATIPSLPNLGKPSQPFNDRNIGHGSLSLVYVSHFGRFQHVCSSSQPELTSNVISIGFLVRNALKMVHDRRASAPWRQNHTSSRKDYLHR